MASVSMMDLCLELILLKSSIRSRFNGVNEYVREYELAEMTEDLGLDLLDELKAANS